MLPREFTGFYNRNLALAKSDACIRATPMRGAHIYTPCSLLLTGAAHTATAITSMATSTASIFDQKGIEADSTEAIRTKTSVMPGIKFFMIASGKILMEALPRSKLWRTSKPIERVA